MYLMKAMVRDYILVTSLLAVIKYSDQSNSREKGLLLAYSSRVLSIMVESLADSSLRQIVRKQRVIA